MIPMKVVADDKIPFLKGVLEPFAEVVYLPGKEIRRNDLLDADVLITRSITKCDAGLLKDTAVKMIATATIGDDHIDRTFCSRSGIEIATAPGCNTSAVEQYVTSALLTIAEKKNIYPEGKNIGIIGVGNVGSKVKNIGGILGMKALLNDPPRAEKEGNQGFAVLEDILEESDVITLHVPLTFEGKYSTYHLAGESFFSKIRKPVIFINTSRGEVVDTNALKDAIAKGKILASVIDVWENEPDIDMELLKMVDIATPHIAGYSIEGKARATQMVVEAVSRKFKLGIHWQPPELGKEERVIDINCTEKSDQRILFEAVSKVYNIMEDDALLRNAPDNFETLRRNYIFRREFEKYTLRLVNCDEIIKRKLNSLKINL